ncbi:hypothetical protein [Goodfellowiella coeruleoviolacea]|uniref:SWIM-type domain-containing protein n=1 Tax=Goodfellowiella coeruleoviolacea TaxID=334858 RepID=A0AAE3KDF9_9PSEU|nr:hypothetical protein [Goodfellowiella coeruleoviolacea]MCP2164016.1 hypothetical protein [Goodfellowiella coeruleoviolacea]
MTRDDLIALTPEALIALANRGLVKRATKELDSGNGPEVAVEADGTVLGRFPDGVRTALPVGAGLDAASCSCGAPGVCRHRIALVFAYQRQVATTSAEGGESANAVGGESASATAPVAAEPVTRWSPGEFDDAALEAQLGSRALASARRTLRAGYAATVRRPTASSPVPVVELASCAVRFLVPHQLGFVHTDAAPGSRDDVVALAVWACREADQRDPDADELRLNVGGQTEQGTGSGIEPALGLVTELLLDGAAQAGTGLAATLARVRRDLDGRNLRWPVAALDDLTDQLNSYRARSARHHPERVAELIGELHARHRAVRNNAASPRTLVLGTEESAETPLRRVRLVGLGCRVSGVDGERTAEVFLAHADTGVVLVLRRTWESGVDAAPTGHDLAARRVSGTTLGRLAIGNVVTESAVRTASRAVRIASNRVAKTSILPSDGNWADLPDTLLVRDFAAAHTAMRGLPPRVIRPRVEAEFVRAVEISEVRSVGYHPGAQRLDAEILDARGQSATVSASYRSACPGALDSLERALRGELGRPRFVSGTLRRTRGRLVIDPVAVVAGTAVIVPDFAPGDGSTGLELAADPATDPLTDAIDAALALLAEAAHRGLRHLPATFAERGTEAASTLHRVGLTKAGEALREFAAATPTPERAVTPWLNAQLRLQVTAESR